MTRKVQRTFNLTAEQSAYVDSLVTDGEFEDPDAVIAECLQAFAEEAPELEDWQIEATRATYDKLRADPASAIPLEEAWARLDQLHRETLKKGA